MTKEEDFDIIQPLDTLVIMPQYFFFIISEEAQSCLPWQLCHIW